MWPCPEVVMLMEWTEIMGGARARLRDPQSEQRTRTPELEPNWSERPSGEQPGKGAERHGCGKGRQVESGIVKDYRSQIDPAPQVLVCATGGL